MGWSLESFWNSTPYESSNAYVGWCKRNGVGKWDTSKKTVGAAFTETDISKLQKKAARLAEEYPDTTIKEMFPTNTKEQRIVLKKLRREMKETKKAYNANT